LEPSLTLKQYIVWSEAAKKTLSLTVAGEAMTGFEMSLLHFIIPLDWSKQKIPNAILFAFEMDLMQKFVQS
jgi:hypothetical protein